MRRPNCDRTVDTDTDGLPDCREYALVTEPHNPDTDGGGIKDGEEVGRGTDPLDPADDVKTQLRCSDSGVKRHYTTIDGVSYKDLVAAPDPDFATFSMGVKWCVLPSGPVIESANPTASLSGNWVFLGVLENFGLVPYHTPSKSTIAGNRALGTADYGVRSSAAEFVANFAPTGVMLKGLIKAGKRYKRTKKHAGKAEAKRAYYRTVKKKLDEWEDKFEKKLARRIGSVFGVSKPYAEALADVITDKLEAKSSEFERKLSPEGQLHRLFKKVFKAFKVPLWKVNAGVRVFANGSYQFVNASTRPARMLREKWEHKSTP
jgi:hypothetical protein